MTTEFDLSSAVDEIFAEAKPGEILKSWNEWGCGQYAGAGAPLLTEGKREMVKIRVTEASGAFLDRVFQLDNAHPHAAAHTNVYCLNFAHSCANSELALAA